MRKTLHTYFENWPKDKPCQLYFHSEVPITHLCEQYFRFTAPELTDETRVMFEYHGIKPKFVETTGNLMKVTYPEDIEIIQCLMDLTR